MPILQVGSTSIPYTISRSSRARRQRIVVTSGVVEVIAPDATTDEQVAAFVHERRRWVFDTRAKMLERNLAPQHAQRYVSGAKIPFRGRQTRIQVQEAPSDEVKVAYRSGFVVTVPEGTLPIDRDALVEGALHGWLKDRLRQDVVVLVDRACRRLEVEAKGFRLREQKHLWGSCGKDGILYLNWHLIFVPKPVLEYAVVHEVCHLRHRTHSRAFWSLVRSVLPDYEVRKAWLDRQARTAL